MLDYNKIIQENKKSKQNKLQIRFLLVHLENSRYIIILDDKKYTKFKKYKSAFRRNKGIKIKIIADKFIRDSQLASYLFRKEFEIFYDIKNNCYRFSRKQIERVINYLSNLDLQIQEIVNPVIENNCPLPKSLG